MSGQRITVNVTKRDIENGAPSEPESCPIALAVRRKFPDRTIQVDTDELRVIDTGKKPSKDLVGRLPRRARNFIEDFDWMAGDEPDFPGPFSFQVTLR